MALAVLQHHPLIVELQKWLSDVFDEQMQDPTQNTILFASIEKRY